MKNIITNILLLSAVALPVFTSCSSDDETTATANKKLLEIDVLENTQTKAASQLYNSIPSKSYYGIFLADNDNNVASNCNNAKVYYYDGKSTITPAVELNSNDRRVLAYYPYDGSVNPANIDLEGLMAGKDVMIGRSVEMQADGIYSSGYVNNEMNKAYLKLTHAKSCITFNITQEETWTNHIVESVSIQVPIRYAGVDLFTGKYVGDTDANIPANVLNLMTNVNEIVTCNFLVAPTIKEGRIYAKIQIDGTIQEIELPVTSLTPGVNYVFNVTVKKDISLVLGECWIESRDEQSTSSMDWEIEY